MFNRRNFIKFLATTPVGFLFKENQQIIPETFQVIEENGNVHSYLVKMIEKEGKKFHVKHGLNIVYGNKFWYINGQLHREDGPAVIGTNGDKVWYKNGKRHREDGPAVEWANGTKSWCINGKYVRIKAS